MSGSGKTTVARGLMALFVKQGYKVQPFKCGPDYIDTKFHEAVCGRPSINLDTFMATPEHVRQLFARYAEGADVCIVEGMMGLYDGYDRDGGSSAEIARVLGLPVVLVVDAKSAAYSMAALLYGFTHFTPPPRTPEPPHPLHIAGVIFNKVGSSKHAAMLWQVCDDLHIDCLGCVPKSAELEQGSRYLGLDFSDLSDNSHALEAEKQLTQILEQSLDLDRLLALGVCPEQTPSLVGANYDFARSKLRVLTALNSESFSFLYQEALDRFRFVRFFDPEKDVPDFSDIDMLYLPGGYPEKHLEALVANEACRRAIRDYAERGGGVVAECGGMMYLCRSIVTDDGEWPMCGVLPYRITARRQDRRLSLGYRHFSLDGCDYRGHEFHYTRFMDEVPQSACQVYNAKCEPVDTPVFRYKNVLASYTHLYQLADK